MNLYVQQQTQSTVKMCNNKSNSDNNNDADNKHNKRPNKPKHMQM